MENMEISEKMVVKMYRVQESTSVLLPLEGFSFLYVICHLKAAIVY